MQQRGQTLALRDGQRNPPLGYRQILRNRHSEQGAVGVGKLYEDVV
jgi:hypothetical protein